MENQMTLATEDGRSSGLSVPAGSASSARRSLADRKDYLRARIRERDGNHCHWCGVELRFEGNRQSSLYASIDHLTPKSQGGHRTLGNCVLACRKCNNGRHHAHWKPTDWSAKRNVRVTVRVPKAAQNNRSDAPTGRVE